MKVAILGAGSSALSYAAFLSSRGHVPVLWSPSGAGTAGIDGTLRATGVVEGELSVAVAARCEDAVVDAGVVLVAVPAYGYRRVLDALAPVLSPEQLTIISAHCSFAALFLSKRLAQRRVAAPVAAFATTVVTGRRGEGPRVNVSGLRNRLDVATVPADAVSGAVELCSALFGDRFDPRDDILPISLSNLNPPAHMANALCNFTRIERGETWFNYDGITPSVARLMEALDRERLEVAAAFGIRVRTLAEHYRLSFREAKGETIAEMAAAIHAARQGPPGPTSLDTRFVTEDVPFGLYPLSALGSTVGVETPLHDAGIAIFSALYGRDFRRENDILPEIDFTSSDLLTIVRKGYGSLNAAPT